MSFSKAKMYRNQIVRTADGKKVWAAMERAQITEKLTEVEMKAVTGACQQLEDIELKYNNRLGKYACHPIEDGPGEKGRGEVDVTARYQNDRAGLYESINLALRGHREWNASVWNIPSSTKPNKQLEAHLAEFESVVDGALDAANALYSAYIQTAPEMTGTALLDYRRDTTEQLASFERKVANASSSVLAVFPQASARVHALSKPFVAIMKGHKEAYANQTADVATIAESWEDLCIDDSPNYTAPDMTQAEVRDRLLGNTKFTDAFDHSVEVAQDAGHPAMRGTRVAASTVLYLNAARRCRRTMEVNGRAMACVVDVGAGSFGPDRLMTLKRDTRNANVFVHAMIPIVDAADRDRFARFQASPDFISWNAVHVTGRVNVHRLNWCNHRLRDCTCLDLYSHVEPVAVHSSYYLLQADYDRLFKKAATLEAVEHIPQVGTAVPTEDPEYVWENAENDGVCKQGFFSKLCNTVRRSITGVDQVRMQPLKTNSTTYTHPDNGETLRRGGFHPNRWAAAVDRALESNSTLGAFAAGVCAAGAIGGVLGSIGQPAARVVGAALMGAGNSLAMTTLAATFVKWDALQPIPWLPGEYSIEKRVAGSFALPTGEQVCHIVRYTKVERATPLEPQVTHCDAPATDQVGRVAAAMVTGDAEGKTARMMAAVLLREKVPARVVRATIDRARQVRDFLLPAPPAKQRPPWLIKGALAVACQPFVSGVSKAAASAMAVSLCPPALYAPATITFYMWTTSPVTVLYLLFAAPMHLFGLWLVLYLTDRMGSV
ncbi:hypothetical protein 1 [Hubei tombus-like virus 34]|uniref:hypothetical protein 1 n=1 Tax=Hubei tombus-like virus 34 TaxID=1923282 RepID=UPI00090AE713|nr:hypothetical protein 1 [Hubei tombus-like virus 34]APG76512.1 hypothetical protein 1 [Hubei tombus-like virus 34]